MSEHKIGDLVIRYYYRRNILGYIKEKDVFHGRLRYHVEWIDPPDDIQISIYAHAGVSEGRDKLNEYLRRTTQDR